MSGLFKVSKHPTRVGNDMWQVDVCSRDRGRYLSGVKFSASGPTVAQAKKAASFMRKALELQARATKGSDDKEPSLVVEEETAALVVNAQEERIENSFSHSTVEELTQFGGRLNDRAPNS